MATGMVMEMKETLVSLLDAPLADAVIFGIHIDGHLFLETLLVVVIAFLLLQKSYQPEKRPLTEQVNSLSLSVFHAVDLPLSLHNDKLFFSLPVSTTYFLG
jgi:hypothetical protein